MSVSFVAVSAQAFRFPIATGLTYVLGMSAFGGWRQWRWSHRWAPWNEQEAQPFRSGSWHEAGTTWSGGGGGAPSSGGGAPPSGGGASRSWLRPWYHLAQPVGEFVYVPWPVEISAYPRRGEPLSWSALKTVAADAGVHLNLRGRKTVTRPNRWPVLTVKGSRALDVYRLIFDATKNLGIDVSRVPLVQMSGFDEPPASGGDSGGGAPQPAPVDPSEEEAPKTNEVEPLENPVAVGDEDEHVEDPWSDLISEVDWGDE